MTIEAVLFDVGGPLDTEVLHEQLTDTGIRAALEGEGITVTDTAYAEAGAWAVASFAPDTYKAIIWRLAGRRRDVAERAHASLAARSGERHAARGGFELRAGIPALLEELAVCGLALGLAANQPVRTIAELDRLGIGGFFRHREVSAHHGFRKPDVRLFLRACDDLGVTPDACIMVGDRIDNDIAPARLLGMRTVLLRTGRHIAQQPRGWDEVPDAEAEDVEGMRSAITSILGES